MDTGKPAPTMSTLFNFSKIEILDFVASKLIEQNVKSELKEYYGEDCDESEKVCAYRGDNGVKCAIEHLLTDQEYSPEMEGSTIRGALLGRFLRNDSAMLDFLEELQNIHDVWSPSEWRTKFDALRIMENNNAAE